MRKRRGGIDALAWCEQDGRQPHAGQVEILRDQHRFKIIVCGARYGKSWSAARWAEARLIVPGARGWAISGTYDLADKVYREVVETFARRHFIARVREDEHLVILKNGSWLKAKSTDHPNSLDAEGLDFAVYDEAAKSPERIFYQKVLPRLLDRRGELFAISTANGLNYYYDLFKFALDKEDAEYAAFNAPSWGNSKVFPLGVNDPEIIRLRLQYERMGMSALFEQEYGGSFAHLQGRVYSIFDRKRHVMGDHEAARGCVRFIGGVDYGAANPSALLVLGQTGDGGYRVVDEWFQRGKTHDEIVSAMAELNGRWGVKQWWSDHEPALILAAIRRGIEIGNALKGDIPAGCMVVAAKMAQPNGFGIATRCKNLLREIETYVWRESAQRGLIDDPVKKDDHACDALRYALSTEEHVQGRQTRSTRISGL